MQAPLSYGGTRLLHVCAPIGLRGAPVGLADTFCMLLGLLPLSFIYIDCFIRHSLFRAVIQSYYFLYVCQLPSCLFALRRHPMLGHLWEDETISLRDQQPSGWLARFVSLHGPMELTLWRGCAWGSHPWRTHLWAQQNQCLYSPSC